MERKVKPSPLLLFALGFLLGGVALFVHIPYVVVLFIGLIGLAVFFENPFVSVLLTVFGYIFLPDILCLLLAYGVFGLYMFRRFFRKNDPLVVASHETVPYVYFLLMAIQTVTSIMISGSLRDMAIHTAGLMLLIMIVNEADDEKRLHEIFSAIAIASTVLALIGIAQYVIGIDVEEEWVDKASNGDIRARVYSLFGNPNIFAEYLVMTMPILVGVFWTTKRDSVRLTFIAMFLINLLALFMTMSRGGWLGLAVAAFVFLFIVRKELLLLAIPISGVVIAALPQTIISRFMTIFNLRDTSTSYRFKIWEVTGKVIHDHFLIGLGLGHLPFKYTFERYIRTMPIYHAHNTFIQIFAEIGLVGFILFLIFIVAIFINLWRYPLKSEDPYMRVMGAAMTASFAGMLFHGMFENIFYMTKITTTFWILLAITFSLVRICKKRNARNDAEKRIDTYGEQSFI
ncbi:MAG: O-antigen ligase family protein [Peptoniphilus sp.]|nr:O-antigen ligase family protein [Peptoniphilus sp.]MDD7362572.1 O-antigen ligase family protein [Bacillota bacterium]MDY6045029.1 O-antigen ligase family protein [Peptoniphilus sp.]